MKNNKGFTLIELLVAIILLGILAATVIFAVGSVNDNDDTPDNPNNFHCVGVNGVYESDYNGEITVIKNDDNCGPN